MSVGALPVLGSRELLKVLDAEVARAVGRSTETVRSYRLGRITPPAEVVRAMAEFRYARAQRMICEGRAELQRLESEARLAGLAPAAPGARLLAAFRMGRRQGATRGQKGGNADPTRDAAESAS